MEGNSAIYYTGINVYMSLTILQSQTVTTDYYLLLIYYLSLM